MRGPDIPADTVCPDLIGTIDLLPTFAAITGSQLPKGKKIDGLNAINLLTGKGKSKRNEFIHYTSRGEVEGIRQGNWKLLIKKKRGKSVGKKDILLFDLEKDLEEKNNLATQHPVIVTKLQSRMEQIDGEITQNARAPWNK
jgi:arylsulfatase A-like enzyme